MPRVPGDIEKCLDFVARQPWGKPANRELDIYRGIDLIRLNPGGFRAQIWRAETGIWLRRSYVAQFAIIYTFLPGSDDDPRGVVSIRAIRHQRVGDVFQGVKEVPACYTGMAG